MTPVRNTRVAKMYDGISFNFPNRSLASSPAKGIYCDYTPTKAFITPNNL